MKFQIIISAIILLTILSAEKQCPLKGVTKGSLNGKLVTIYSVRHSREGLEAHIEFNTVRHNPCPGGGACKWIFKWCQGNEFAITSKKYRSSYMYGNIVNAVSHYNVHTNYACKHKEYMWKVYFDSCSSNYYLQNSFHGTWLDSSDTGLVKHSHCNKNEYYGWNSCGKWRRWSFQDIRSNWE